MSDLEGEGGVGGILVHLICEDGHKVFASKFFIVGIGQVLMFLGVSEGVVLDGRAGLYRFLPYRCKGGERVLLPT